VDEIKFSSRIRELRLSKKLTQEALGQAVGLQKQTINDMEHGRIKTTLDRAALLADFFKVTMDYLVGRNDFIAHPAGISSPSDLFLNARFTGAKASLYGKLSKISENDASLLNDMAERLIMKSQP
jgi:transcriptional regulator with XRE-family HTH domain